MNYSNDHELFVFMREQLSSSLLSDALDEIGLRAQTMRENIRPCWRGAVVAGRAHTAAYAGIRRDDQTGSSQCIDLNGFPAA